MSRLSDMTREFHQTYGLPINDEPTTNIDVETRNLRIALIEEELSEFTEAALSDDLIEVADALADLLYVVSGAAHVYGIDIDAVLEEVHSSNMSKLDENGKPIYRFDGKVLKSHLFVEPDIASVLEKQYSSKVV